MAPSENSDRIKGVGKKTGLQPLAKGTSYPTEKRGFLLKTVGRSWRTLPVPVAWFLPWSPPTVVSRTTIWLPPLAE